MKSTATPPPGAVDVTALLDADHWAAVARRQEAFALRLSEAGATARAEQMFSRADASHRRAVALWSAPVREVRCRCSHARIQHRHGAERCYLAACGCARFRPVSAA